MAFQPDTFQGNAFQVSPGFYNQNIALGLTGGFSESALLAALNNLGFSLTAGMSLSRALNAINTLNFILTGGFSVSDLPAATAAFDGNAFQNNAFQVNNVYTQSIALGLTGAFQASFGAIYNTAISLGLTAGFGLANSASLTATLAVAAVLGIAEAQQLIMNPTVALSVTAAESVANVAALGGSVNLSAILGDSVNSASLMNALVALNANGGFSAQIGTGNVYGLAIALGLTSVFAPQGATVMTQPISLNLTAGDLTLLQSIGQKLNRFRPIRFFLSLRYRSIALAQKNPDDEDWDW